MEFATINPANGELLRQFPFHSPQNVESVVAAAASAQKVWRRLPTGERAARVASVATHLGARSRHLAELMTMEMGKPFREALSEVEKCQWACEYYGEQGPDLLEDRVIETGSDRSYVTYQPLGLVLAVMPWNFPFWQAIRAAVPALIAGNGVLLKHAPNVPSCALAISDLFGSAGLPDGLFGNLFIDVEATGELIRDPRVQAVSLTGSTRAGSAVAGIAGAQIKTSVLELGGSDPYLVLEDADLPAAVEACVTSRLINNGQSCVAAKRFVVHTAVADEFTEAIVQRMGSVRVGDPMAEMTDIGPLAREDLRDHLADQVETSVRAGARCLLGGKTPDAPGWYYPTTVLADVRPGMPAYDEELFGPVASIIRVDSEEAAIQVANDTPYGLGAAVFTRDLARGERIARTEIESGCCFVNDFVRSDPRLPFGGVKASGFGRELSDYGIREFVNVKTVLVHS